MEDEVRVARLAARWQESWADDPWEDARRWVSGIREVLELRAFSPMDPQHLLTGRI